MNEKPLERLNYYNGQRLEASDLKTEQDYHIRTRRWLNKSLYSAGIARGLEVRIITEGPKKDTPYVSVSPGLALDNEGREIILLEEETVEVCSFSGTDASTVVGNYLVIEYAEETIAYEKGGCAVRTEGKGAAKSTAPMGGPSRIQSTVKFSWVPFVPHPGSNQIVLAQVELKDGCKKVGQIDPGKRRYIGAASAATVRQYALEGEREVAFIPKESFPTLQAPAPQPVDVEVVGRIYFHIRNRQPNAVILYLWAEKLSPLHYTELGLHLHGLTVTQNISTSTPIYHPELANPNKYKHKHGVTELTTKVGADAAFDGSHTNHELIVTFAGAHSTDSGLRLIVADSVGLGEGGCAPIPPPIGPLVGLVVPRGAGDPVYDHNILPVLGNDQHPSLINGGIHQHKIAGFDTVLESPFTNDDHTHTFSPDVSMKNAGVTDLARIGDPLEFVDNLQILVGPAENLINRTTDILQQLSDANSVHWRNKTKIGEGGIGGDVLKEIGTGPIRLDFLPYVSFAEGEYCIELKVAARTDTTGNTVANGGKIHYNLYIE